MTICWKDKAGLRLHIAQLCEELPVAERSARSLEAIERIKVILGRIRTATVMFYSTLPDEVDTMPLVKWWMNKGNSVLLPRVRIPKVQLIACRVADLERDLIKAEYGIRVPASECESVTPADIDVVVVPGRAFDERCNRLGRGRGFYDRFLKELPPEVLKVGLAFEFQLLTNIPVSPNDVAMDVVVTDQRTLHASQD